MISDRISHRYALSLYDLAVERKELDDVVRDFETLHKGFENSRELVLFLNNPILGGPQKMPALSQIFKGKVQDDTLSLIELLARKGREELLPGITEEFLNIYRSRNNIQQVQITSATQADQGQVERIRKALSEKLGTKIELKQDVNPELIGGFIVDFGDRIFDGSASYALRKVEKELLSQTANS